MLVFTERKTVCDTVNNFLNSLSKLYSLQKSLALLGQVRRAKGKTVKLIRMIFNRMALAKAQQ